MPIFEDDKKQEQIEEMRKKEAEDLAKILSQRYGLPYLDLSGITIDIDALKILPEAEAREAKMAVFQKVGQKLQTAIESPNPEKTKRTVKDLENKGYKINLFMVSEESLKNAWKRYAEVPQYEEIARGVIDISSEKLEEFLKQTSTLEDLKNIFVASAATQKNRKISEVLEIILAGAIAADASDIHIEPQDGQVRLRMRLDGVLHDILSFDYKVYNLLLSRIKLVSGLKLNIHNQAQDGRFSIRLAKKEIEVRSSVIPESYGESIVLRVLNPESIDIRMEGLGMEPLLLSIVEKELKKPNGMILTTGPTGSGKSTTLYAFLKKIYTPGTKIITLEDPVEYHVEGVVQTQVEEASGYTFSNGLRSILRQDPDVIMVGEIRDLDTARTAMNAALTGHLVLSTLHTNNAAGTIPRLVDLGVTPSAIAPAVNLTMAQRLVRKLCDKCKEKTPANAEESEIVRKTIASLPENYPKPETGEVFLWRAKGCPACNNIGYKGRIGVFEAILINEELEPLILTSPGETEILKESRKQGLPDMKQDGVLKVLKGVTSLDELQRVVDV
ncbi:MAG: GspE/PulE family protein [Candidatus Pacebacteria bacterium]|nr:GspE/PulE family protein [Candidatus Paceibacterota bacterium]NUQ56920.1 type II/IV secretion system protein [Candidatus Paceibacter sp.]